MEVHVHPRVSIKHPEVAFVDVEREFSAALCSRARNTEPVQWVGAGLDARGGLLEFIAIETGPDRWLVLHAMVATKKVLRELGLAR